MTFRAKPVVKRVQKPSWESRDRRNFYLNLGFSLVVLAALLILAIAVAVNYYNEHLVAVGRVDGQSISKDELRDRTLIESWRLDEAERRIRTETVAGRLTQSQAELQQQFITQQREQVTAIALERIIDNRIQANLATAEGVAVSDGDIDAKLLEEATIKESRHVWQIEVAPAIDPGAVEPTPAQVAAARSRLATALADLRAGKPWDDIAKTVSTDAATAPQAGDLGWMNADDTQTDEAFLEALFAAEVDTPTDIVEGEDGILRVGRVTETSPETVDAAYTDKIVNDGVDLAKYRAVVRGDVLRQKLEDKLVADATKPAPQRQTAEIYLTQETVSLPADAVKVRHILYSPKDDPEAASGGEIPENDPSWAQAKTDAEAAFAKLQADPAGFDALARSESDEQSARGPDGTGGVLDGYVYADAQYVPSFSKPILDAKPSVGQLIGPFKTEFGYHVVEVLSLKPDLADIKRRVDGGADFAKIAREISEGAEASNGGDLGWIARNQLEKERTDAIFAAPVGKTSEVVQAPDEGGQYLFLVRAEAERTPEGRQLDEIRSRVFTDWYQPKKEALDIYRDPAFSTFGG
jgi:parvulin-like peptidyl-prolyl isomerase